MRVRKIAFPPVLILAPFSEFISIVDYCIYLFVLLGATVPSVFLCSCVLAFLPLRRVRACRMGGWKEDKGSMVRG